jgi:hypothetical protein
MPGMPGTPSSSRRAPTTSAPSSTRPIPTMPNLTICTGC